MVRLKTFEIMDELNLSVHVLGDLDGDTYQRITRIIVNNNIAEAYLPKLMEVQPPVIQIFHLKFLSSVKSLLTYKNENNGRARSNKAYDLSENPLGQSHGL